MNMFFPVLYSETHYHLRYLFPKYYKKEPEIIFDFPFRIITERTDNKLIFFLIVKDADKFPVRVCDINLEIYCNKTLNNLFFTDDLIIDREFFYKKFEIPIEQEWYNQCVNINVNFSVVVNNIKKKYRNDNYYGNIPHLFKTYISHKDFFLKENWYRGDVHYHSNFTSDQVEFGAPISVTKDIAIAMGLDWFFVTDHSYDLDDRKDSYTEYDDDLQKWHEMKNECITLDEKQIRIIAGEEVSIANSKQENIHLLAVNHKDFIHGSGDSAEMWFKNKPEHDLSEIKFLHSEDNLFISAHPFDKVPFVQRLLLNRGLWSEIDFKVSEIKYLQIVNGQDSTQIRAMISKWLELLLQNERYYIVAGNDAHGNFQFMKQISIPFLKLMCRKQQLFGQYFTMYYNNETNDPIQGIKGNRIIVSNGPFVEFYLDETTIGETFKKRKANLIINTESNKEFGKISKIVFYLGDIKQKTIKRHKIIDKQQFIELPLKGFACVSIETEKGYFAMTNPVWIEGR